MRVLHLALVTSFAAATLGLAACAAGTGAAGGDTGFIVPIEVENNMSGLAGASIYISRSTGSGRRLLGPVESGAKRTFDYDARAGVFKLTAKQQGVRADSVVSEPFQLQPGMVIQWSIPANRVLTGTR